MRFYVLLRTAIGSPQGRQSAAAVRAPRPNNYRQLFQVPKDQFPFTATIIKDNERLVFS